MMDFAERLRKARILMAEKNMDVMILSRKDNFYYLTGVLDRPGAAVVVPLERDPIVLGLWIDYPNILRDSWIKEVRRYVYPTMSFPEMHRRVLSEMGLASSRIGIEKSWRGYGITVEKFERFKGALPEARFVDANEVLKELRKIKTEEELELLRQSARIASRGMEAALRSLREGVTELEVAAEAEYVMKIEGAEGLANPTMVGSGERSTWAHPFASDKRLQNGELVVLIMGAVYKGYNAEISRTAVVGEATQKQRRLLGCAVEVQKYLLENLKIGMRGKEIEEIADRKMEAVHAEKLQFFVYGIGLDNKESPDFSRDRAMGLEGNMVFTAVNCQLRIQELGVAKISDTIWMPPEGRPVYFTSPPGIPA